MKITFVADYFMQDLPGGSERSLQAIIDAAPEPVKTVRSGEFRLRDYGPDDFVIFGNFHDLPLAFLPEISDRLNYVVIESDHKYCTERSPEQHQHMTGQPCDCHKKDYGKRICHFYEGAKVLFWKSSIHMQRHLDAFPILGLKDNIILSATYSPDELDYVLDVARRPKCLSFGWAVFKSNNWIKGYEDAVDYCKKNKLWRMDVKNKLWTDTIKELAGRRGLVFLPRGMESCSRIAIEAHLLGLDLVVNKNVPVVKEEWFGWTREKIAEYLKGRTSVFWDKTMECISIAGPVAAEIIE